MARWLLDVRWRSPVGWLASPPLVADGRVFVADVSARYSGELRALSAVTGEVLWSRTIPGRALLASGDGVVVARVTGGTLLAVDAATGRLRWTRELTHEFALDTAPVVAGGAVFVSSAWSGGSLYAFSLDDGTLRWRRGDWTERQPAVAGGQVLLSAGCTGEALDPADGSTRWARYSHCTDYYGAISGDGGALVTANGSVADAADGRVLDRIAAAVPVLSGDAIVARSDDRLYHRSRASTVDRWAIQSPEPLSGLPVAVDDVLYQGTASGTVVARDLDTGGLLWSGPAGETAVLSLAAGSGRLIALLDGELVALGSATASPAAGLAFTGGPSGPTRQAAATVTFNRPGGLAQTCSVDGGLAVQCSGSLTLTALADGPHTVTVRAVDGAGVVRGRVSRGFTVDRTGPATSFVGDEPVSPARWGTVEAQAAADDGSATVECRVDDRPWRPCREERARFDDLPDGVHTVQARSMDVLGNVGPAASRTVVIDSTPPDLVVDSAPPASTRDTDATIAFRAGADAERVSCTVQGYRSPARSVAPCASPLRLSGLAEDGYTVEILAVDAIGNEVRRTVRWDVDRTPPEAATWWATPGERTNERRPGFRVAYAGSDLVYDCQVDGGPWERCDPVGNWWRPATDLADGEHRVVVRVSDAAGNVGPRPTEWAFVVDTVPPVLTLRQRPPDRTANPRLTVGFDAEGADALYCGIGWADTPCTSPWTSQPLGDGRQRVVVAAADRAGNRHEQWVEVVVDTTAPDTRITDGPPDETTSQQASFRFGADEEAVTFECSLDGGDWAPCEAATTVSEISAGEHVLRVRATDAVGHVDRSPASWRWRRATGSPPSDPPAPEPTDADAPGSEPAPDQPAGGTRGVQATGGDAPPATGSAVRVTPTPTPGPTSPASAPPPASPAGAARPAEPPAAALRRLGDGLRRDRRRASAPTGLPGRLVTVRLLAGRATLGRARARGDRIVLAPGRMARPRLETASRIVVEVRLASPGEPAVVVRHTVRLAP